MIKKGGDENYHVSRKADYFIIRLGLKKSRSLPNKQLFLFLMRFFRVPQQRRLKMDGDVIARIGPSHGPGPSLYYYDKVAHSSSIRRKQIGRGKTAARMRSL